MRVLLIQLDGKMPNLALMKIGRYHRNRGDDVGLSMYNPEKVYVSCIFNQNLERAKSMKSYYPNAEFVLGGPGLNEPNFLQDEIEHSMPLYELYPEMDYSLGYTTRGCVNHCPFCIVPRMEGKFREHAPLSKFVNPDFNKLVLWDNNFLASKLWKNKLTWIKDRNIKVCFNQGLDARLITEDKANLLLDTKAWNLSFKNQTYYFAWDLMENNSSIINGLNTMIECGCKPYKLMVYVLVGFNTTHEEDFFRFMKLREMKIDPFIMKYNNKKDDPWLNHFARWVNKRIYKSKTGGIEEYKDGVLVEPWLYNQKHRNLTCVTRKY